MNETIKQTIAYDNYLVIENGSLKEVSVNENFVACEVAATDALVGEYIYQALTHDGNKFEQPNKPSQVIFIQLKKDCSETLQIIYSYVGDNQTNEHVILVNEAFSSLEVIENSVSIDLEMHGKVSIKEVFVKKGSTLNMTSFDELCSGVESTDYRTALVYRDATFNLNMSEMNDANTFGHVYTNLVEENAMADTHLVTIANNKQKQLFTIRTNHYAPHTNGNIVNHGVVMEHSYVKFDGIGYIPKGSHQSNAQQESRLMILGERGRADANPILLIDEHDVMAGHAASVGKIDEEQLYYLQSRGLSRSEAEKLIVHGFLKPIVEGIKSEKLVDQFLSTMMRKLG